LLFPLAMLYSLAILSLALTGADHWTTYLCLRRPVAGWDVSEANPVASLLFDWTGLVPGLMIDSIITLVAVLFVATTVVISSRSKALLLALISLSTGYAVMNNVLAIDAMGLWPGLSG